MAQKVPDGSVYFSGSRPGRSGYVRSRLIEQDDTTVTGSKDGVSVTFQKDPNRITRSTLTRSEIPPKRDGKRKHHPHKWRGEEQTGHTMRAIFGHVTEDGVVVEPKLTGTMPESWRGTRSPELTSEVVEGDVEAGYQDRFWRAV